MAALKLPRTVDRGMLRMITVKRFVTGSASLVFSLALAAYGLVHFAQMSGETRLYCLAGVAVFAFGGSWSLRDALRGRRLLRGEAD